MSTFPSKSPTRSASPSRSSNSNTGAIVGGAIGGSVSVVAISIAVSVICQRRRSLTPPPGIGKSQPLMDETKQLLKKGGANMGLSLHVTSLAPWTPGDPMTLYVRIFIPDPPPRSSVLITCTIFLFFDTQDPNDPTTYPAYQGDLQSHNGTRSNLANMQTSRPEGHGYHGFPVPTV